MALTREYNSKKKKKKNWGSPTCAKPLGGSYSCSDVRSNRSPNLVSNTNKNKRLSLPDRPIIAVH